MIRIGRTLDDMYIHIWSIIITIMWPWSDWLPMKGSAWSREAGRWSSLHHSTFQTSSSKSSHNSNMVRVTCSIWHDCDVFLPAKYDPQSHITCERPFPPVSCHPSPPSNYFHPGGTTGCCRACKPRPCSDPTRKAATSSAKSSPPTPTRTWPAPARSPPPPTRTRQEEAGVGALIRRTCLEAERTWAGWTTALLSSRNSEFLPPFLSPTHFS